MKDSTRNKAISIATALAVGLALYWYLDEEAWRSVRSRIAKLEHEQEERDDEES